MLSRFFALCNLLGPPSLNRFVRLFQTIYNCWLPEFLVTKRVTQSIFNLSCRKSYYLILTGAYFHPIFYRPFPQNVQILLQIFYDVFIWDFPINYGPGSSVGIATGYGLECPGIESRWSEIFRTCPDRVWGPLSPLYNGYPVFPGGKERPWVDADSSSPSSAVVVKE